MKNQMKTIQVIIFHTKIWLLDQRVLDLIK